MTSVLPAFAAWPADSAMDTGIPARLVGSGRLYLALSASGPWRDVPPCHAGDGEPLVVADDGESRGGYAVPRWDQRARIHARAALSRIVLGPTVQAGGTGCAE